MSLPPSQIGAKLAAAGQRLAAGDQAGASAVLRDLLQAAPSVPEAHFMVGAIAAQRGDHEGALTAFDQALEARPGFVQALAQKARSLDELGRRAEAIAAAEGAGAAQDAYTLDTIGVVMTRAGRHTRAAEFYARAVRAGTAPGYWYNYAASLQFIGKLEDARVAYRECLKRDSSHGPAWAGLVQITKQTSEQNEIATLTRIAGQNAKDARAIRVLGHALAKAYEDLGDSSKAMDWLLRAKASLRDTYDAQADEALFEAAEKSAMVTGAGLGGLSPIFVVGMPRTGTTLVERIISNHSQVESAGELDDFPRALKRVASVKAERLITAEMVGQGAKADAATVGRAYLESVRRAVGLTGRFVDKLPLNSFLAPQILRALPDARIICLRRHPADAVLSNYRQDFASGADMLGYAFDLESTARYYVRWDRMVRRFAEALPKDRFTLTSYEDIVGDLEGQVRRLLAFCGLDFEDACLRFEENTAPVSTASAAQVRQPLYSSSVGRWRKYRPAIDPALRILVDEGVLSREEID